MNSSSLSAFLCSAFIFSTVNATPNYHIQNDSSNNDSSNIEVIDNKDKAQSLYEMAQQKIRIGDKMLAIYYLEQAALYNHIEAQFKLAQYYESKFEKEQMLQWYLKAAENNHPQAQYKLGNLYFIGYEVKKDNNKAVHWMEKAANQNWVEAQFDLGWIYSSSAYDHLDYKKAVKWYGKAAKNGSPEAANNLAVLLLEPDYGVVDYKRAFKLLLQAQKHSVVATVNLADLYLQGKGTKKDVAEAVQLLERAAEQDSERAYYELATMHFTGNEVITKNEAQGVELLIEAADLGYTDAEFALAQRYEKGQGVEQSYSDAFDLYDYAARKNDADALYHLGLLYYKGLGTEQDLKKAVDNLAKAASFNHQKAMKLLKKIEKEIKKKQL